MIIENKALSEVYKAINLAAQSGEVDIWFTGVLQQVENGGAPFWVQEPIKISEVWPTEMCILLLDEMYDWSVRQGDPNHTGMYTALAGSQTATNRFEIVARGYLPTLGTPSEIDLEATWPAWTRQMRAAIKVEQAEEQVKELVFADLTVQTNQEALKTAMAELQAAKADLQALDNQKCFPATAQDDADFASIDLSALAAF